MTPALVLLNETLEKGKKKKLIAGKGAWQHAKDEAKKRGKPASYAAAIAAKISHKSKALDVLNATLAKALGGEGSRGGHVLAHTKSGRPVYASGEHVEGYQKHDLIEAASVHDKRAKEFADRSTKASGQHKAALIDMQREEQRKAKQHRARAGVAH